MTTKKELSAYLKQYYSYHQIKNAGSDKTIDIITSKYIQSAKADIFKQPEIALRVIKVEMNDILTHHSRYIRELQEYRTELDAIVSKGPRLDEINLAKAEELEEKRDVLAEFIYLVEDSLAQMVRMLLNHYPELDKDKPFLDNFSKFLSPHDWMSKRVEKLRNELVTDESNSLKPLSFERQTIDEAKKLIENDEILKSLNLLLSKAQGQTGEKDLISFKRQWLELKKRDDSGLISEKSLTEASTQIVSDILSILKII